MLRDTQEQHVLLSDGNSPSDYKGYVLNMNAVITTMDYMPTISQRITHRELIDYYIKYLVLSTAGTASAVEDMNV
jgi:hypothetical protein